MASRSPNPAAVEIFGAAYHLRSDKQAEYLQNLASVVDGKMRDAAERSGSIEVERLAILAALNLADELFQCRERHHGERGEVQERLTKLAGELEKAVGL
jgi:cell division protein ZapA